MPVEVREVGDDLAAVSEWSGVPLTTLRADPDYDDPSWTHLLAWRAGRVVGALHAWRAPDLRRRLYLERCDDDALAPLLSALDGPAQTTAAGGEAALATALVACGFTPRRRELVLEVPVTRLVAPPPPGVELWTADRTTLEPLLELDCELRQDIPGADGWQPDATWFRSETYDSEFFDPATYCVAVEGTRYVGLARVWRAVPDDDGVLGRQRLGCVGVRRSHRRRGLARAMLGSVFAPLADRGVAAVAAEVDATNAPSRALFASLGATTLDEVVEFARS